MKFADNSWTYGASAKVSDKQMAAEWQRIIRDSTTTSTGGYVLYPGTSITVSQTSYVVPAVVAAGSQPAPARQRAPLAFSPHINATEMVMEFLAEARSRVPGLTREQFLKLTIGDFFAFLIRRAAEADGVPPPEIEGHALLPARVRHRCGACGRFLSARLAERRVYHCNAVCLDRALAR